jgi:peptidyl-dipeptidase A
METIRSSRSVSAFVGALGLAIIAAACTEDVGPTVDDVRVFLAGDSIREGAEPRLLRLWVDAGRAAWVQNNFITDDTNAIASAANTAVMAATTELAAEAAQFNDLDLPADLERKMTLLRTSLSAVAPSEPVFQRELAEIMTEMESVYGQGEYCADGEEDCYDLPTMERMFAELRETDELLDIWVGWRDIAPQMRPLYERFVELSNAGARELGFADTGEMWRSGYDMPPDEFTAELERLWEQVRPLYESLHCHVRAGLGEEFGTAVVPEDEPIPAHLLGNMWSQTWANIYDAVGPSDSDPGYDLTRLLERRDVDEREMVRYGERFFSSLGFAPLPRTFWDRSLFVQPVDRDVVCHASAWDLDFESDVRIKMCIGVNDEDFVTIHHELGHNYYQRAYATQDPLYRTGANDGFHEGIGDTIALSITPEYLVDIGLLNRAPSVDNDIGLLLRQALDKIAFLPFGLLVDQWRWRVFSGEIAPEDYNAAWWDLREQYQGVRPAIPRTEESFDPGAKYHVPANTPYTRYFLAHILQFQFHRALCEAAGVDGPLHRCSIFGSEEAGGRLVSMLEMGASQPWPDALEVIAGTREMDATAILDYFAPLAEWLDEQNEGRVCGW